MSSKLSAAVIVNRGICQKLNWEDLYMDRVVYPFSLCIITCQHVCDAIFKAAGALKLETACIKIGHCDSGSAVINLGFKLKSRFIIHAVGHRWSDGRHGEPELLYNAYKKSLELAVENGCSSIHSVCNYG